MAITNGFEMVFNRRLIFGENKVTEIPGILNWYNKKKVLFVTFSAEFDAFKKISSLLTDAGMAVVPYEVKTEPTLPDICLPVQSPLSRTFRKAMQMLADEGLIEKCPGKGTIVLSSVPVAPESP